MKYDWEKLNNQQKGTYGEYFVKMEFTMYGFEVYTSEVDDRGIDFVARKDNVFYEVQVKTITKFNYTYIREDKFKKTEHYLTALVKLTQGELPNLYLFKGTDWDDPPLLLYRKYENKKSFPEYGINISKKSMPILDKYLFEIVINNLGV